MWILSLTFFIFSCVGFNGSEACITTSETPTEKVTPNTACRFPFVYNKKTINGCIPDKALGKFWCSTKVEEGTNKHVKDNWGFCPPECRKHQDTSCPEDHVCRHTEDCPQIKSKYEKFKTLRKGPEKKNLYNKLKSLKCNVEFKYCCPLTQVSVRTVDGSEDKEDASKEPAPKLQDSIEPQIIINEAPTKSSYPHPCQEEPTSNFLANILPSSESCGLSCNTDARVIKGEDAKLGEFPWAALLGYQSSRRKYVIQENKYIKESFVQYKCGGTLINTWYVLTAAHCHGRGSRSIYQVVLGEWEVSDRRYRNKDPDCISPEIGCMPPVQKILVDKVVVHDDYRKNRKGIFKDIALIRLKKEAVLNAAVQMACLPLDTLAMAVELQIHGFGSGLGNYTGTVIGWGHTENWDDGDIDKSAVAKSILQKAKLPLWSIEDCQEMRSVRGITAEHLCAGGGEDGADSCKGDSGGGIFIKKNTTNLAEEKAYGYVQVGLVSFGSVECGDGSPGVYTRVAEYIDWIKQNMEP